MGRQARGWDELDEQGAKHHLKHDEAYIPLITLEWSWDKKQVLDFDSLWTAGHSVEDIAAYFHRDPDEILVLAIDRARRGKIRPRRGGILGADNPRTYGRQKKEELH